MESLKNTIIQRLESIYQKFCEENPSLRYVSTEQNVDNRFHVAIQASEDMPATQNTYTQFINSCLTQNWSELVRLPEALTLIRSNDIHTVTVAQLDANGITHSVAIL